MLTDLYVIFLCVSGGLFVAGFLLAPVLISIYTNMAEKKDESNR